jgi:hypothetical protein
MIHNVEFKPNMTALKNKFDFYIRFLGYRTVDDAF